MSLFKIYTNVYRSIMWSNVTATDRGSRSFRAQILHRFLSHLPSTTTMSNSTHSADFVNYPQARKGPVVAYKNETQSIPVFRGIPLAIGAAL